MVLLFFDLWLYGHKQHICWHSNFSSKTFIIWNNTLIFNKSLYNPTTHLRDFLCLLKLTCFHFRRHFLPRLSPNRKSTKYCQQGKEILLFLLLAGLNWVKSTDDLQQDVFKNELGLESLSEELWYSSKLPFIELYIYVAYGNIGLT